MFQTALDPKAECSRIVVETFASRALYGNALGDPHVRPLPVYLPPGYDRSDARYPAVYFLAGIMASGVMELNVTPFEETIQQRLDRLIAEGRLPPVIVVLPDPLTRYGGSQFLNSSATGRYADYLLELVSFVDARFRTRAHRDHRAVMGKSSGGFGALHAGMRSPEIFSMVADHSGDKYFEFCYLPDIPRFVSQAARYDLARVLQNPAALRRNGVGLMDIFYLINIPAMCACYSPNPDVRLGFDLVVDLETGELDEEVWQRWLRHDPVRLVEQHADALKSLRLLFFDAGTRDEFHLQYGGRIFSKRLNRHGIAHQFEEFDSGHSATQFRFDVSLEAIGKALPR